MAVPSHEPDEKLFSWLARTERLGGYAGARAVSSAFFGHPNAGLKLDFPSHLGQFVATVPNLIGDVDAVVEKATPLPYLTRFRPAHIRDAAVRQITGTSVAQLKFHLGMHAGSQRVRTMLRICPSCYEFERRTIGMSYWHRVHQLPGVAVCPQHAEPLRIALCSVQDKQTSLFLPDDVYLTSRASSLSAAPAAMRLAQRLARLSETALNCTLLGGFQEEVLCFSYRHGLKNAGFLSKSGYIRVESLKRAISASLTDLPSDVQLGRAGTGRDFELLLSILRRKASSHPLPHLILIDFLFESWEAFCSIYAWEQTMRTARESDESSKRHTKREDRADAGQVAETDEQDVGNESLASKRLRHRTKLVSFMRSHPDATRSRIASLCTASWKWLYRNDKQWLDVHLPVPLPKGRYYDTWVDWQERDRQLCAHLVAHADAIRFESFERITPATLLRKLPPVGFSIQAGKMPQSYQLIVNLVRQHRHRRVV